MGIVVEAAMRSKLTIHLDENLHQLESSLRDAGFKIFLIEKGTPDDRICMNLEGDVLLTKNVKDFKVNAVIYDFDIISVEKIKFIDNKKDKSNITSQKISNAVRQSEFYNKRGNFLLTVMDDGEWELKELK